MFLPHSTTPPLLLHLLNVSKTNGSAPLGSLSWMNNNDNQWGLCSSALHADERQLAHLTLDKSYTQAFLNPVTALCPPRKWIRTRWYPTPKWAWWLSGYLDNKFQTVGVSAWFGNLKCHTSLGDWRREGGSNLKGVKWHRLQRRLLIPRQAFTRLLFQLRGQGFNRRHLWKSKTTHHFTSIVAGARLWLM